MNEFEELRLAFNKLTQNASKLENPDVVSNTALRVIEREADAIFNQIQQFYPKEETQIVKIGTSKTKVLLIKPVGDHCNLRCTYCYETLRLAESHEKIMKIAQVEKYLKNFVGADSGITEIFLHGGEPLMAGKSFFNSFIDTLKKMQLYGTITLGVQTNATLLDEEWVAFLKLHDFRIGISLDGDKEINDQNRIDHKGRGSYDAIIKGMNLLKQHNVPFGVICVVSAETASVRGNAKRILNHFISLGLQYIDIHPAFTPADTSGTAAHDNLSAELYCRFMTELTEAWAECPIPNLRLRCIEDVFENLSNVKSSTCYAAGLCTSILGMDPSGNVSPCTRPFHSKYNFGNADVKSIAELEQSAAYRNFADDEMAGRINTASCQWSHLCGHGGCPHERFSNGMQDPKGRHIFCTCTSESDSANGFPGFYRNLTRILKNYMQYRQVRQLQKM